MTVIVDRIEEGFAVVESESVTVSIPLADIPFEVAEGDVLVCDACDADGGALRVTGRDEAEKTARSKRINKLFNKLFRNNQV